MAGRTEGYRSKWRDGMGTFAILMLVLVVSILIFSLAAGGGQPARAALGVVLAGLFLWTVNRCFGEPDRVRATWYGILAGLFTWQLVGELGPHFGFVTIEDETGALLFVFAAVVVYMLWRRQLLPQGPAVFSLFFLLNWGGHVVLLAQQHLRDSYPFLRTTYLLTGALAAAAFICFICRLFRSSRTREERIVLGVLMWTAFVMLLEVLVDMSTSVYELVGGEPICALLDVWCS